MKIRARFLALALPLFLLSSVRIAASENDAALRAREFVVMGYQGIQNDLERGSGPYLSTLGDLLGYPAGERRALGTEVEAISKANPNIMDFADKVSALRRAGTAATVPVPVPTGPTVRSGEDVETALRHLTRGAPVVAYLHGGEKVEGSFVEFKAGRLWLRGAARRSIPLKSIAAVDVPAAK